MVLGVSWKSNKFCTLNFVRAEKSKSTYFLDKIRYKEKRSSLLVLSGRCVIFFSFHFKNKRVLNICVRTHYGNEYCELVFRIAGFGMSNDGWF